MDSRLSQVGLVLAENRLFCLFSGICTGQQGSGPPGLTVGSLFSLPDDAKGPPHERPGKRCRYSEFTVIRFGSCKKFFPRFRNHQPRDGKPKTYTSPRAFCRLIDRLTSLFALALIGVFITPTVTADAQDRLGDIRTDPTDRWAINWSDPVLSSFRPEYERTLKKILVLDARHEGHWWSDTILSEIRSEFKRGGFPVEFLVEYMDTIRYSDEQIFPNIEKLYRAKYRDMRLDMIIAAGSKSLEFLLKHRDDLFPDVPIVFCGVENFEPAMLGGHRDITGVMQERSFRNTVEVALRLHPSARQVVLVGDGRPKWLGPWKKDLFELTEELRGKIDFVHLSFPELTMDELLEKVRPLGDESIVVLLTVMNPRDGRLYTLEEGAQLLEQNCKAPVYIFIERALGFGPVGGNMVEAALQARCGAEIALRILNGQKIESIPVVRESPNKYVFDHIRLERFGILPSELPEGSIIINKPVSFYSRHEGEIWAVGIVAAIASAIITVLSVNILRRKKAEKRLLRYQGQLKSLATELSAAEEQLRRRIGTRLHDEIGQALVISKIELETLGRNKAATPVAQGLKKISNFLDQTIGELRSLTFDLSSPILYELGLEAALAEWLKDQVEDKHGIETRFEDDGSEKPLDEYVRALLFRVTQELLFNVIKHAGATKVKLSVGRSDDHINIFVEDNGRGCEPAKMGSIPNRAGGFGLFSIRERLEQIGGKIDLDSTPGRGCSITITSPLKSEKTTQGAEP